MVDLPRLPMGKLKSTEVSPWHLASSSSVTAPQVLVEVHAAGVNPTDWKQRKVSAMYSDWWTGGSVYRERTIKL